jgi:predicted tellurium resistance membrane protein TerC
MAGMDATVTAWLALAGGLVVLLLIDLFVLHRGAHVISMRDAAWSTAGFVAISVAFGVALGVLEGAQPAEEFFAGYLLEKSLSLDNVFVWALIFSAFSIPPAYQHRVLFYGIFGALILRGGFVAAGAQLLQRFEWIVFLLAGARAMFAYLDVGLAVILIFIGAKFMLTEIVHIGIGISLGTIVGVMTIAIVASLRRSRQKV